MKIFLLLFSWPLLLAVTGLTTTVSPGPDSDPRPNFFVPSPETSYAEPRRMLPSEHNVGEATEPCSWEKSVLKFKVKGSENNFCEFRAGVTCGGSPCRATPFWTVTGNCGAEITVTDCGSAAYASPGGGVVYSIYWVKYASGEPLIVETSPHLGRSNLKQEYDPYEDAVMVFMPWEYVVDEKRDCHATCGQ